MPAATQTRHIRISVDTKGSVELDKIARKLGGITKDVRSLRHSFEGLRNTILGFTVFGIGIQQIVQISDEMQNLNNRLVILTGSQQEADRSMELLLKTANETNTSIDSLGQSYARLATSLRDTGVNTETLLDITKVLTNTFRLSGSTIGETSATIVQLSQAFASGQLRGQELRSVLEQNATLAVLLRQEFGKDIFKKAADGAITAADVMRVLFRNMDDINAKAQQLTPTIGQTLVKALNGLKVTVGELNKDFNISGNFAKTVEWLIDRIPLLAAGLAGLAATQIPALLARLPSLTTAAYGLGAALRLLALNPLGAALTAIGISIVVLADDMKALKNTALELVAVTVRLAAGFQDADAAIYGFFSRFSFGAFDRAQKKFKDNANNLRAFAASIREDIENSYNVLSGPEDESAKRRADYLKHLEQLYGNAGEKADKLKDILGRLNQEFIKGQINASQYGEKLVDFELYKLNREFREGKFDLLEYNKRLGELTRQNLNRQLKDGVLSIEQFNRAVSEGRMAELRNQFDQGRISVQEFNLELAKVSYEFSASGSLRAGAQAYVDQLGTTTQQMAGFITNTFQTVEDSFLEFIKTGEFNFKKFAQSVIDDLTRIIIRAQILQPLANALATSGSTAGGGATAGTQYASPNIGAANGAVFDKGLKKFATGGVVNSPTMFGYGRGKTGLMGEAGPEAILPLARGAGGRLGVEAQVTPVNVVVNNYTSAEATTKESVGPNGERTIEILITNKVKEGIANGKYDRVMQQSYGLQRKGS